ncbi:tagaturonate reductase [Thermoflexibacter ruber]|uniref:Tagaturonate reductase n=1 Tax=Thermoflexibacter ruber TaxID=1003 RepID=A0A1I2CQ19_9BACT|nr:tagaturonate reductase [Thermoflexibacter ruber]SFE70338.1 tagaturonate reductase [Thermoflexibacter ruber]
MQQLSQQLIRSKADLPEKVLQFGTGILLRGLPDFFIDKANKAGIFQGKIVIVKSTSGGTDDFQKQDGLFTTCIRGIQNGQVVSENIINESISRVISANDNWNDILMIAQSIDLQVVISNTTEVGIQYVEESIFAKPPTSFPAKLTAVLYKRFKNQLDGLVIIPTELIPDNGLKLKNIVLQLIEFNHLGEEFKNWVEKENSFCNSLVDRIVTNVTPEISHSLPYQDALAIQTEPYRLWAIQGDKKVKEVLSFAQVDEGVIIAENIDYYRERKLRLLNGTHTISVCKGYLKGFNTVYECMQDAEMQHFIKNVMLEEIAPTVLAQDFKHLQPTKADLEKFAYEVLDRFGNPHIVHYLLSITLQATSKMKMRNIPTILRYYQQFGKAPHLMAEGFKAYLLFMRVVKEENGKFYGKRGADFYLIQDDYASYFAEKWKNIATEDTQAVNQVLHQIYNDADFWGTDLTKVQGFIV